MTPTLSPAHLNTPAVRLGARLLTLAFQRGLEDDGTETLPFKPFFMAVAWEFLTAQTWHILPRMRLTPAGYVRARWRNPANTVEIAAEFGEDATPAWTVQDGRDSPFASAAVAMQQQRTHEEAMALLRDWGFLVSKVAP